MTVIRPSQVSLPVSGRIPVGPRQTPGAGGGGGSGWFFNMSFMIFLFCYSDDGMLCIDGLSLDKFPPTGALHRSRREPGTQPDVEAWRCLGGSRTHHRGAGGGHGEELRMFFRQNDDNVTMIKG